MKTTFWILFALFMIIYSAEPNIKFKPFSISFESPYIPFAIFFLILSILRFHILSVEAILDFDPLLNSLAYEYNYEPFPIIFFFLSKLVAALARL